MFGKRTKKKQRYPESAEKKSRWDKSFVSDLLLHSPAFLSTSSPIKSSSMEDFFFRILKRGGEARGEKVAPSRLTLSLFFDALSSFGSEPTSPVGPTPKSSPKRFPSPPPPRPAPKWDKCCRELCASGGPRWDFPMIALFPHWSIVHTCLCKSC